MMMMRMMTGMTGMVKVKPGRLQTSGLPMTNRSQRRRPTENDVTPLLWAFVPARATGCAAAATMSENATGGDAVARCGREDGGS